MTKRPLNISEEAAVQMPMKTFIVNNRVTLGTMGYFQMVKRLNQHSTRLELMEKDLTENTDFRIKWPRGQLSSFLQIAAIYDDRGFIQDHGQVK